MNRFLYQASITLCLALLVHILMVLVWPKIEATRHLQELSLRAGLNAVYHVPAPESAELFPLSGSDFLYSYCIYDLDAGPVRIVPPVIHDSYWSVAIYGERMDNFFVLNDGHTEVDDVSVILAQDAQVVDADALAMEVAADDAVGLVLFRYLIPQRSLLPDLEAARRQVQCIAL